MDRELGRSGFKYVIFVSALAILSSSYPAIATQLPTVVSDPCDAALTVGQKLVLAAPKFARRWALSIAPQSGQFQIDSLHAKLKQLLPAEFAARLLSAKMMWPDHFYGPESERRQRVYSDFNAALHLLREILSVTEHVHGAQSEAAALSHFSLALFYSGSFRDEGSVLKGDGNYYSPYSEVNDFANASVAHSRLARDLLAAHNSSQKPFAELQLVKQLVTNATVLSKHNVFTTEWQPVPPAEGFHQTVGEAEAEIEKALKAYMDAPVSPTLKTWLYVNLTAQKLSLEATKTNIAKRANGNKFAEPTELEIRTDLKARFDQLQIIVANSDAVGLFLKEGREGILFGTINSIRWQLQRLRVTTEDGQLLHELMYQIERDFSKLTATELLERLKELNLIEALGGQKWLIKRL
jgi:hypothetical protein